MRYDGGLVQEMNSMIAQFYNSDYDGDNVFTFPIHSEQGKADFKYAYVKNNIKFEHKDKFIVEFEHEAIYSLYKLTLMGYNDTYKDGIDKLDIETIKNIKENFNYKNMDDFTEDIDTIMDNLLSNPSRLVCVNDIILPYNMMLLNKAILFDGENNIPFNKDNIIFENEVIPKKKIQKCLGRLYTIIGPNPFYDHMHNFDKFLLEAGSYLSYANPSYDSKDFIVKSDEMVEFKKTLVNEPYIGFHQNDILFNEITKKIVDKNDTNILSNVFKSEARIKSVQLLKAASNNGIPTDINGKAYFFNIKESLLDGLPKYTFYKSSDSARLALAQRQSAIPKGGEYQRKFYHETGFLQESDDDDCGDRRFFDIEIMNKTHLTGLNGRFIYDEENDETILIDHEDESLIGTHIKLQSPIFCKSENFKICKRCLGLKRPVSKNTGAAIGSYIPEAIIQSVLRTHHFSGAFITHINPEIRDLIKKLKFYDSDKIKIEKEEDKINANKLLEVLQSRLYYDDEEGNKIRFDEIESENNKDFKDLIINVLDLPFNDDSVKQLNNIASYIDRNRSEENLISIEDMYKFLNENISFPNGIYSLYVELIISILFYKDDVPLRYTDGKEFNNQIALGKIIEHLDPKLSIFHNFSKSIISKIYQKKNNYNLDHMHYELLSNLK